jgi:hypothetical protein
MSRTANYFNSKNNPMNSVYGSSRQRKMERFIKDALRENALGYLNEDGIDEELFESLPMAQRFAPRAELSYED